jgi:glycosyltransferase involved in cell wall biosynthesis/tetratricopeptide (TPR) repeat protein
METSKEKLKVLLEGDFLKLSSLAGINRALLKNLSKEKSIDLSVSTMEDIQAYERNRDDYRIEVKTVKNERYFYETIDADDALLHILKSKKADKNFISGKIDYHIHHKWPLSLKPLNSGYYIIMQPWEFGYLPKEWVAPFNETADDIWVYSNFLKQSYIESGINPGNISVVHPFIDKEVFRPKTGKIDLPGSKKFKFLFVGGTIYRKGIDILINTYLSTFKNSDDVCLVIKDVCSKSAYAGQSIGEEIIKIAADKNIARVIYLQDEYRTDAEMARLYNSCDCLVHPYRAEGFGLPVAEAMACGLPVIVTEYGACLDFCNIENSFMIKSGIESKDEKIIGNLETVGYPYWANPDRDSLSQNMRYVFENHEAAQVKASNAIDDIHKKLQYKNTIAEIKESFSKLSSKRIKRFILQNSAAIPISGLLYSGKGSGHICGGNTRNDLNNTGNNNNKYNSARNNNSKYNSNSKNTPKCNSINSNDKDSTLAVCLIVKNEERNILRCLESVRDVADEIIVVDTGSQDNTCRVAKSYGAKVRKYAWNDSFSEARNYSIKDIGSDWIFFLDADEVLENKSIEFLKNLKLQPKAKAYYVKFLNMQSDTSEVVLTEHYNLRLFNNNFGFKFTGAIHEQLQLNNNSEYEKDISPVELRHYGYSKNNIEAGEKAKRNTGLLLKAIKKEPKNAFNYYNMGVNLHTEDKYREAIEYFDKTIEVLNKTGSSANYLPFCLSYKSSCYCFIGNYCKAISEAKKALKLAPDFKVAYFNLANAYYFNNEFEKAAVNYKNAIEAEENIMFGGSYDKSVGSWKSYNGLGLAYLKILDFENAKECLEKAYMLQNKSPMIIINLAVLYKLTSNVEKLSELLADISDVPFNIPESRQLADILLHFSRHESAIKILAGIITQYQNNKTVRDENGLKIDLLFMHIAEIYFMKGDYEKAIPYFKKALKEDEKNYNIINYLGLCYLRLKNYNIAAQYFSKAIDYNNREPSYFSNLGNCLSEQGYLEDAELSYNCALLLNPGYLPAAIGIESVKISRCLNI